MKKILFFTNSSEFGGVEKALIEIINYIDESRYDITVISTYFQKEFQKQLKTHVHYRYIFKKYRHRVFELLMKLNKKLLRRLFLKQNFDYEVAFQETLPFSVISAGTDASVKKICWIHNNIMIYDGNLNYAKSAKNLAEEYDRFYKVVCVSNEVLDCMRQKYPTSAENRTVIYNPINEEEIIKKSNIKTVTKNRFTVCAVGRLTEQKGIMRLLRVYLSLFKEKHICDLWIIGDGDKRDEINSFVDVNNLSDYVKITGFLGNPYPNIKCADLFICPSYKESFGISAAEAIVLKTPVLSVDNGGVTEVLCGGKYGAVCPNEDNELFTALKKVLTQPEYYEDLKLKVAGYNHEFSLQNTAVRAAALFE